MGFRNSWLAFSGASRDEVLARLHLFDTGEHDEAFEAEMSAAQFPAGWTIVWLSRFDHPFTEDSALRLFSKGCTVIAGHVHEGIMFASTQCYRDGDRTWSIFHDCSLGRYHLETEGVPPGCFERIRAEHFASQDADGGEGAMVDHVHGIPFAVARELCGFEYDRWRYGWGEPRFTVLRHRDQLQ
jgi:hypothetical protein